MQLETGGHIFFVSGLPRSGSTLLTNLLAQHPHHHVTPTSGLIEMFALVRDSWRNSQQFRAEGLDKVRPRIRTMLEGMVTYYFKDELVHANKVVFDKNRGWPAQIETLEAVLGGPVKIIVTTRDIRAILASFEKLHRNNPLVRPAWIGEDFFQAQTIEGRCRVLLGPRGAVGVAINRVLDAFDRGYGDRLVVVPYSQLTRDPLGTMESLHEALDLPPYLYDPDNVEQVTHEDDEMHGWSGLHDIRKRIEPPQEVPWRGIIPERLAEQLAQEYPRIQALANLAQLGGRRTAPPVGGRSGDA
jgi:sulfotransferase